MSRNYHTTRKQLAARQKDLRRIAEALEAAAALLPFPAPEAEQIRRKEGGDLVTGAERAVDRLLFKLLRKDGEGWLSEETPDDLRRLGKQRVWIVDPLDGTKEYVSGIPEWCISVGLVEHCKAVAGGIYNPAEGHFFLGSVETGLTLRGRPLRLARRVARNGIVALASRSEVQRGEWDRFRNADFTVRPMGSVAYKLALVAAGFAESTWTLTPKHEWDVAAGVALVLAAQGTVSTLDGAAPVFNQPQPRFAGLVALSKNGKKRLRLSFGPNGGPFSILERKTTGS